MGIVIITPKEGQERLAGGECCLLVDVRSDAEFTAKHVEGAILAPVHELDPKAFFSEHPLAKDKNLMLLCARGSRARAAAEKFHAAGFNRVSVIDGGIEAWQSAGLPIIASRSSVISVERQTQIVIGSSVLTSIVLGYLVHPILLLIGAFMGGGLLFAGITNRCPLAVLIAGMPWNNPHRRKVNCAQ